MGREMPPSFSSYDLELVLHGIFRALLMKVTPKGKVETIELQEGLHQKTVSEIAAYIGVEAKKAKKTEEWELQLDEISAYIEKFLKSKSKGY